MIRNLLFSLLVLGLVGCKKKPAEEAAPPPPPAPAVSIDNAPPPAAAPDQNAPPPPAQTEPDPGDPNAAAPATDLRGSTELDDMSKMLQQFVIERKRFPTDVNEMAKLMGFRVPRLPAGATLVIDKENKTIRYVPPK